MDSAMSERAFTGTKFKSGQVGARHWAVSPSVCLPTQTVNFRKEYSRTYSRSVSNTYKRLGISECLWFWELGSLNFSVWEKQTRAVPVDREPNVLASAPCPTTLPP